MAVNVNLLPENLVSKKGTTSAAKVIKSVTLVSLVSTVVLAIGLTSFFLISSFTLRSSEASLENLKTQIKSQETTEQKMVLLKDRLAKIKLTKGSTSLSKPLADIKPVLDTIPAEASLGELNVDAQRVDTTIVFRDSVSLTNFFGRLTTFKNFPQITLTSFGFNPTTGYLVGIRFNL